MINRDETAEPWSRTEGAEPRPVDSALSAYASSRGWARRLEGARIHGVWLEIAGAQLAAHTSPARLHGGVLVIHVTSSSWAAQVPYFASQIITKANEVLGEGSVTQVVVARSRDLRGPGR